MKPSQVAEWTERRPWTAAAIAVTFSLAAFTVGLLTRHLRIVMQIASEAIVAAIVIIRMTDRSDRSTRPPPPTSGEA